ncbi:hypothetical protein [Aquibacillus sediminis]|uniref:hypothetical protein n=1 Tax=Aquibacillus sediminis TaxID=2574734 RepID=UPI0011087505|nr:hypothetical protein [Aquibacillus sediminis]
MGIRTTFSGSHLMQKAKHKEPSLIARERSDAPLFMNRMALQETSINNRQIATTREIVTVEVKAGGDRW